MKAKFSEYMFCTDHYYLSMKSRVYLSDVVCIFLSILSFSRENTECMYSSIAPRSNRDSLFRSFSLSFSSETINAPIHRFTQYRVHTIQNISIKALVSYLYQCYARRFNNISWLFNVLRKYHAREFYSRSPSPVIGDREQWCNFEIWKHQ